MHVPATFTEQGRRCVGMVRHCLQYVDMAVPRHDAQAPEQWLPRRRGQSMRPAGKSDDCSSVALHHFVRHLEPSLVLGTPTIHSGSQDCMDEGSAKDPQHHEGSHVAGAVRWSNNETDLLVQLVPIPCKDEKNHAS